MVYLILALIVGLPLSQFFLSRIDIWHAQGLYAQFIILLGFALSLAGCAKQRLIYNWPLFWLFVWVGFNTTLACYGSLAQNKYNTSAFFQFFNFLTISILYYQIVSYVPKFTIQWIVSALEFVIISNLIWTTLQFFGISQFTQLIYPDRHLPHNPAVGFIGNGTHNSAFIAIMLPILFINKTIRNILAVVLSIILLTLCGEIKGDPAVTGFLICIVYGTYVLYKKHWALAVGLIGLLAICAFAMISANPHIANDNGRFAAWSYTLDLIQHSVPLTGNYLGTTSLLAAQPETALSSWRHLHQEFLQFTFELGIIGLSLILAFIYDLFKTKTYTRTEVCLKLSLIGFLVSCCFLSSSHLWMITIYMTIIYSVFKILTEDSKWASQEKRLETKS